MIVPAAQHYTMWLPIMAAAGWKILQPASTPPDHLMMLLSCWCHIPGYLKLFGSSAGIRATIYIAWAMSQELDSSELPQGQGICCGQPLRD